MLFKISLIWTAQLNMNVYTMLISSVHVPLEYIMEHVDFHKHRTFQYISVDSLLIVSVLASCAVTDSTNY